MKNILLSLTGIALALSVAPNASYAYSKLSSLQETQVVWQHHIDAWTQRDLDAIAADYAEDSVILVRDRAYTGPKEIRELFTLLFKTFDRAEKHVIDPAVVANGLVYITWNARIAGKEFPVGTDTFVIADGKIKYQTITSAPDLLQTE